MSTRDISVGTDFDFDTGHFEQSCTPPKKKKSDYPYIPKGTPLQLPPCRVCGAKASGIHYGVNSCEACKGFFRRYLLRKEPYKCSHGGNCEITDRHRGNCSACRMKKCLDLGMSKEGIRQGRYTLTERTKAIMEVKRLQNPELQFDQKAFDIVSAAVSQKNAERTQRISVEESQSCMQVPISPDCNRQQALSDISDDRSLADRLLDFSNFSTHNVSDELTDLLNPDCFFSEEMEIPNTENILLLDSDPCPIASPEVEVFHPTLYDDVIDNLVGALNDMLPHSSQFTDEEIFAILKEGYDKYQMKAQVFGPLNALSPEEYNAIYEKTQLDVDGRKQHLQLNKGTLETMIKKYVNFSHAIPSFSDLPAQDQATLLKASRFEFFMLLEYRSLNPDLEMIQTYSGEVFHLNEACIYVPREMMKSWLEFTRTIKKLELTNKELAVTLAVALTFRDRCRLEQPSFIEQIQDNLVRMLHYLLEDHHGDEFMMAFSRIISMLTGLRSLTENYFLQFKTICKDKFIKREMPELLDRCSLSSPDRVEEIQDEMVAILHRLLRHRHKNDSIRRFSKIIDMFIKFRELTEGYMKCYQSMCSDKFHQENMPEMLKFLFDGW